MSNFNIGEVAIYSPINRCHWNIDGTCTNYEVTRNKETFGFSRDWDSKQNFALTIYVVHKCDGYKPQE